MKQIMHEDKGQATVEFAILFVAMLAIVVVLILLWHASQHGSVIDHVALHLSHSDSNLVEELKDVTLY